MPETMQREKMERRLKRKVNIANEQTWTCHRHLKREKIPYNCISE